MDKFLLAKAGVIVYKYSTRLNFSVMKHVALSLLAAACGALSASALDASNARIWLEEKIQPDFTPIGSGIASEKYGTAPAYARGWQYVSIPLHVEGVAKGDSQPHFIPELTVRISLVVSRTDEKGKTTDTPELFSKEITYVDIPLAKSKKANRGEGMVNVGVFVSPSQAFKLAEKDGNLSKKLIAVAVEGTFAGSSCNRIKEKANENVTTAVIVNTKEGRNLSDGWWTKSGGSGSALASIAETPFAHDYARLGFPATKPMYGAGAAPSAPAPVAATPSAAEGTTSPVSGGYDTTDSSSADSSPDGSTGDSATEDDSTSSKGKKGKKGKKSRR